MGWMLEGWIPQGWGDWCCGSTHRIMAASRHTFCRCTPGRTKSGTGRVSQYFCKHGAVLKNMQRQTLCASSGALRIVYLCTLDRPAEVRSLSRSKTATFRIDLHFPFSGPTDDRVAVAGERAHLRAVQDANFVMSRLLAAFRRKCFARLRALGVAPQRAGVASDREEARRQRTPRRPHR